MCSSTSYSCSEMTDICVFVRAATGQEGLVLVLRDRTGAAKNSLNCTTHLWLCKTTLSSYEKQSDIFLPNRPWSVCWEGTQRKQQCAATCSMSLWNDLDTSACSNSLTNRFFNSGILLLDLCCSVRVAALFLVNLDDGHFLVLFTRHFPLQTSTPVNRPVLG